MDNVFISNTATGAWTPIIKLILEAKNKSNKDKKRKFTTVSGPGKKNIF
jgi:hypothetical protein